MNKALSSARFVRELNLEITDRDVDVHVLKRSRARVGFGV